MPRVFQRRIKTLAAGRCLRCPQIITGTYEADEVLQQVAGIPKRSNGGPHSTS